MIDLHIHLLPGVDDGAADATVARAMLARAAAYGYRTMVATPHLPRRLDSAYLEQIVRTLAEVRALADGSGIDVRLGFEAQLTPDLPARLQAGEPATLAGSRTILVDLPFAGWPHHAESSLFALQRAGFRPVLAHPERYAAVQDDPARALDLAEQGILLQATIGSFTGLFGSRARQAAEHLLRHDAIHFVATDAHSAGHRFANIDRGLDRIGNLVGEARLRQLVHDVPRALLDDADIPATAPAEPRSQAWHIRLRRRFVSSG